MTEHLGCRVCLRRDVSLKKDETLRQHVRAELKGKSFLIPSGNRCSGTGHPPKGVVTAYTRAVVKMLSEEFTNLQDPMLTNILSESIQQQQADPRPTYEFLLDARGDWRLLRDGDVPGAVQVYCFRAEYETDRDRTRVELLSHLMNKLWRDR